MFWKVSSIQGKCKLIRPRSGKMYSLKTETHFLVCFNIVKMNDLNLCCSSHGITYLIRYTANYEWLKIINALFVVRRQPNMPFIKLIFISTKKPIVQNTNFLDLSFHCRRVSMSVSYLMYLSLHVSRNFSSWVGVMRSSWYRTLGFRTNK